MGFKGLSKIKLDIIRLIYSGNIIKIIYVITGQTLSSTLYKTRNRKYFQKERGWKITGWPLQIGPYRCHSQHKPSAARNPSELADERDFSEDLEMTLI
jgi:hypothetical protein